jgi:hypothetical protein
LLQPLRYSHWRILSYDDSTKYWSRVIQSTRKYESDGSTLQASLTRQWSAALFHYRKIWAHFNLLLHAKQAFKTVNTAIFRYCEDRISDGCKRPKCKICKTFLIGLQHECRPRYSCLHREPFLNYSYICLVCFHRASRYRKCE